MRDWGFVFVSASFELPKQDELVFLQLYRSNVPILQTIKHDLGTLSLFVLSYELDTGRCSIKDALVEKVALVVDNFDGGVIAGQDHVRLDTASLR